MDGLNIEDLDIPETARIIRVVTIEDVLDELGIDESTVDKAGRVASLVIASLVATLVTQVIVQHVVPYVKRKIQERKQGVEA